MERLGTTPLNSAVNATATSGSSVYAGGYFTDAGGNTNADRIAFFAPTQSTTTLTASPNPALVGQAVTLRAMVSCPGFTPTGNVQFFANGSSLGTVALNGGGQATLPTSFSKPGVYSLTANYAGDENCPASATQLALSLTVNAPTAEVPEADTLLLLGSGLGGLAVWARRQWSKRRKM